MACEVLQIAPALSVFSAGNTSNLIASARAFCAPYFGARGRCGSHSCARHTERRSYLLSSSCCRVSGQRWATRV